MNDRPPRAESPVPVSILVVDDRPENRLALKAILSAPGYRLVEAGSGAEALRRLLKEEFAVLLVDVVMPEMSGFELATMIRGRERTAAMPIIFVTAQAIDVELIYKGYRSGAVDYMVKPLVPEMVRAKVAVFAELYRQRKRAEEQARLLLEAERRESELRLLELQRAGERHYRSLAEAVPHIVWTARPDGRVDYFNQRWFEYTGVTAEQARGSWYPAVHPDDLARCRAEWEEAMRSGERLSMECRLRRRDDGEFRWHLCRAVPERGPQAVISWLGTFTDIEAQKRAQAVLAEFKGTLDAVLDAVLIFDAGDWRLRYVNQGASVLLSYSRDELLRLRPVDFMPEYDDDRFRELLAPLVSGSTRMLTLETFCQRRDGRRVPVELSAQHILIEGGRIASIARDITDRRRAELERELLYREALDAVQSRDEFISVASHELRTPLSSLRLQVERMLRAPRRPEEELPEALRPKLQVVSRQVDRLTRLISQLLDVTRISAGRLPLELEEMDLSALTREVINRFSEDAARAGCAVVVDAEAPVRGRWDRLRLEQVLVNLLTNALKFGEGKPVEVSVSAQGPRARLSVRDHGIGIAPEDAERIFQRFERATQAKGYGGLGLGLYIARQIVKEHGGDIRMESRVGSGAKFTVELPLEPAPEVESTEAAASTR